MTLYVDRIRPHLGKSDFSFAASKEDGQYLEDTVLEIASLTKLVTVVAALQIVEKGLINLDDDVSKLIPSFAEQPVLDGFDADGEPLTHKRKNVITLRLLLSHSSGAGYTFRDPRLVPYMAWAGKSPQGDGTVDGNFDHPLSYEPGEGFLYSSSMDRVGQIIEQLSGQTLEDYTRDNIWKPLDITSASFWDKTPPTMAVRPNPDDKIVLAPGIPTMTTGWKECSGGQGLFMNMKDYIKILFSLMVDDEELLTKQTSALLFQPSLGPTSKKRLLELMKTPDWAVGDFPDTGEYDWSLGGLLIDGDSHEFRKRNAVIWSGATNSFWVRSWSNLGWFY